MLVSPQLIGAFLGTTWQCSFICAIQLRQGFDCTKEPVLNDITLVLGFMQSLKLMLRIRQRGLSWVALPCGSFSFMSSSGHRCSWWNPYGNLQWQFVHLGNTICSRTCLLLIVAICRSVVFYWKPWPVGAEWLAIYQFLDGHALAKFSKGVMVP